MSAKWCSAPAENDSRNDWVRTPIITEFRETLVPIPYPGFSLVVPSPPCRRNLVMAISSDLNPLP
jgi:hypothetical protein